MVLRPAEYFALKVWVFNAVVAASDSRLRTLHLPDYGLVAVSISQPMASVCRPQFCRNAKGVIKIDPP